MWSLFVAAAMAGNWDGMDADIVATRHLPDAKEQVIPLLSDLELLEWYPDDCVSDLVIGEPRQGYGAPFRIRYHAGPWTRYVEGHISAVGHQHVDLEHVGRYGFTTRIAVASADDGGSDVTMTTFLDPPPWPFKKAFFTRVRPAWTTCHAQLLEAIEAHVPAPVLRTPMAEELEEPAEPEPVDDGPVESLGE